MSQANDPQAQQPNESSPRKPVQGGGRMLPVDALRGFIIIVMALDHANLFIAQQHPPGEYWGLPMPAYDNWLSFLTRFVTHIAAPGFFFLMGVGMLMFARSRKAGGWSSWRIMRHFWIRGALLMVLQLLIVNRAWELSAGWGLDFYIGVLFALGGTMILASLLLELQPSIILILTIVLFVGTEMLHPDPVQWGNLENNLISLLVIRPGGESHLWSNYPILPWMEMVLFGLLFAHWLIVDEEKAYRRALYLGGGFLAAFFLLRWLDGFGNIRPMEGDSWIDFFNVVKYPPSMTFTLLTTAVNLTLLWLFHKIAFQARSLLAVLAVLGRTPLFFYLLHLFLYGLLGLIFFPGGSSLLVMYAFWIIGLMLLYPLCLWFGRFKSNQPSGSVVRYI